MERPCLGLRPPYKTVGLVALMVTTLVLLVMYWQFRGTFTPKTKLTMVAPRAGLVMDPGSKVTYNGVEIGRVSSVSEITRDGRAAGFGSTAADVFSRSGDTGYSIAPYNHLELGSPLVLDYVWGRQLGDYTINP